MKKYFSVLMLISALSHRLCGMNEEKTIVQEVKQDCIVNDYVEIVCDYVESASLLFFTIRDFLKEHEDILPSTMLQNPQLTSSHLLFEPTTSPGLGRPIEYLTYKYSGLKTDNYNKDAFSEKMNIIFRTVCRALNKQTIDITMMNKESCGIFKGKMVEDATYKFRAMIRPFDRSQPNTNLSTIKDIKESIDSLNRAMEDSK